MKLITPAGELPLPSDFQFEIIENNPFFSDEGTQSIPTSLPATVDTINKLGITRISSGKRFGRKFPAKLAAGTIHKDGQLLIASKNDNSVTGSIMLNESDLYSKMKDLQLPEMFSKIELTFTSAEAAYNYLFWVYRKALGTDFAVFPVAVNRDDEGNFTLLNEPDQAGIPEDGIYPLKWKARNIIYDNQIASVPDGFGITPFIYLHKLLELTFSQLGYTIKNNPFRDEFPLNKIVLLNNCSDTICKGKINYSQIVPSGSVSDLLEFLMNRFHATAFVDSESKTIDIIFLEDILLSDYDEDITSGCVKGFATSYLDRKALNLIENTDMDEARPAFETYEKMYEKSQAENLDFSINKVLGTCSEILDSESELKYKLLGTTNFNFLSAQSLEKETFQAKDLAIRMLSKSYNTSEIPLPYIGTAVYRNTKYNNKTIDAGEQDFMMSFSAGETDEGKYYYGTTQNYTNTGVKWSEIALNYPGLYSRCWKQYCNLLLNQSFEFTATIHYSRKQISNFTLSKLKLFNGVPVVVKSRKLNIGNTLSFGDTTMLSTRLYEPVEEYIFPVITKKNEYYWLECNDLDSYLRDDREYESRIEYYDQIPDFKKLDPPTPEQIDQGGEFYTTVVHIKVSYKRYWEKDWIDEYQTVYFWVTPRKKV